MKKSVALIGLCAAASLFAQGPPPFRGGRGPGGPPEATVTGAPYSGVRTTITQQTLAGGNSIQRQDTVNEFRDGQGRVRTEIIIRRPGAGATDAVQTRVRISDPVAGKIHELDPQRKTGSTMSLRGPGPGGRRPRTAGNRTAMASRTHPVDPNVATEDLGIQTISGVVAVGTRVTRTIPAGEVGNAQAMLIVHETWMAQDLKIPVLVKTSDPRFGTTVTQLNNVIRAEPDSTLFLVPSDYSISRGMGRGQAPGPRPGPRQIQ